MFTRVCRYLVLIVLACSANWVEAGMSQLVSNGDFEAGSLLGWSKVDSGSGSWYVDAPGTTTMGEPKRGLWVS